jgi:hypothetical protein
MTEHREASPKIRGPLVLLHVTLLPCPTLAYSAKSISELAPAYFLENWRLLQEKVGDTILARGILIPHPGEEYDLLEERVLETLDLCTPRILDCGHFYAPDDGEDSGTDSGVSDVGRKSILPASSDALSRRDSEQIAEDDLCTCCSRPVQGVMSGNLRRWNLRIYAANGLMRAGAWAASYSEMERIDVEIEPWLPEEVKRNLDNRREQEDQEEQLQANETERLRSEVEELERKKEEEEKAKEKAVELAQQMDKQREEEEKAKEEAVKRATQMELEVEKLSAALLSTSQTPATRSIPFDNAENGTKEDLRTTPSVRHVHVKPAPPPLGKDIPLSKLLFNYFYLLAQDRRNIAVAILSLLVVFLAVGSRSVESTPISSSVKPAMSIVETPRFAAHSPSISVVSIQTSTELDTGANITPEIASSPTSSLQSVKSSSVSSISDSSHSQPSLPVSFRGDAEEPEKIAKSAPAASESAVEKQ